MSAQCENSSPKLGETARVYHTRDKIRGDEQHGGGRKEIPRRLMPRPAPGADPHGNSDGRRTQRKQHIHTRAEEPRRAEEEEQHTHRHAGDGDDVFIFELEE